MIVNAFNDIPDNPLQDPSNLHGQEYLDNISAMQVGFGARSFKADESGIWLGAQKFADAPFSVDMQGNAIASSITLGSGYSKINIFRQDGIPTSISVGDLWFDTNDGNKVYRAGAVGADEITAGEWESVDDTRKITVFAQDGIPTSLAVGDLWYDTNDDNKPYRAASVGADAITAGEWEIVDDQRAADALLKSGASQTLTGDFSLNDANVKIDGANARILINDGSNDRILIGKDTGGF